ncbi:hypothetical protein HCU64_22610 [Methylobacterium sp. C25]|uniref:hypothetical protein n=1 Tax=Methylobacterium sp. C25 TaxID=2721622 RepID=UPI001F1D6B11|nr:hypothetical protein [Methylobacterium sp. C25]MCE4226539.1 hypothetical protein [Methylobacterium sp. C25]
MGIALALLSSTHAHAQLKNALLCSEDIAIKLKEHTAADGSLVNAIAERRFSLVWNDDYLNLISAGKTEFYECQKIKPRLNENGPKNSIKCQNGIYFITIDLSKFNFARATLDPQTRANVEIAYGGCKSIGN